MGNVSADAYAIGTALGLNDPNSKSAARAWARLKNNEHFANYNLAERPEWRDGTYNFKAIRPEGATYANPDGFEADYKASVGGMLDKMKG